MANLFIDTGWQPPVGSATFTSPWGSKVTVKWDRSNRCQTCTGTWITHCHKYYKVIEDGIKLWDKLHDYSRTQCKWLPIEYSGEAQDRVILTLATYRKDTNQFKLRAEVTPPIPPECTVGEIKEKTCPDGTIITTHRCINGKWQETGEKCPPPPPPECTEGQTQTQTCPDGTVITTHKCVDGKWQATGQTCPTVPPPPPPGCRAGEIKTQTCPDGTVIATHKCVDEMWQATGEKCPSDDDPPSLLCYIPILRYFSKTCADWLSRRTTRIESRRRYR